ncbi:hypothetical protein ACFL2T_07390, partial [Elusimicrobiota bacterium]
MRIRRGLLLAAVLAVLLLPSLRADPPTEEQQQAQSQEATQLIWQNIASLLDATQTRSMGGSQSVAKAAGILRRRQVPSAIARMEALKRRFNGKP